MYLYHTCQRTKEYTSLLHHYTWICILGIVSITEDIRCCPILSRLYPWYLVIWISYTKPDSPTTHQPVPLQRASPTTDQPVKLHTPHSHYTPTSPTTHQQVRLQTSHSHYSLACPTTDQPVQLHTSQSNYRTRISRAHKRTRIIQDIEENWYVQNKAADEQDILEIEDATLYRSVVEAAEEPDNLGIGDAALYGQLFTDLL